MYAFSGDLGALGVSYLTAAYKAKDVDVEVIPEGVVVEEAPPGVVVEEAPLVAPPPPPVVSFAPVPLEQPITAPMVTERMLAIPNGGAAVPVPGAPRPWIWIAGAAVGVGVLGWLWMKGRRR